MERCCDVKLSCMEKVISGQCNMWDKQWIQGFTRTARHKSRPYCFRNVVS